MLGIWSFKNIVEKAQAAQAVIKEHNLHSKLEALKEYVIVLKHLDTLEKEVTNVKKSIMQNVQLHGIENSPHFSSERVRQLKEDFDALKSSLFELISDMNGAKGIWEQKDITVLSGLVGSMKSVANKISALQNIVGAPVSTPQEADHHIGELCNELNQNLFLLIPSILDSVAKYRKHLESSQHGGVPVPA